MSTGGQVGANCSSFPYFSEVQWPAPEGVRAIVTQSYPVPIQSSHPFGLANLAAHVGDDRRRVESNRKRLARATNVEHWQWLQQVHGTDVFCLGDCGVVAEECPVADAVITSQPQTAVAVLTADCLPILLCSANAERVAAVHAGWRGLVAGVVQNTLDQFGQTPPTHAYIGPAIGAQVFEIDTPVRTAFLEARGYRHLVGKTEACFHPVASKPGHYLANLPALAEVLLDSLGVSCITQSNICTYQHPAYYSYRQRAVTGRFATAIWRI